MSEYMDYLARKIGYKTYNMFLASDYWKSFTKKVRNDKCLVCNNPRNLQVHHLTYERLGQELPEDVITVCGECHDKIHQLVKSGEKLHLAHTKLPKPSKCKKRKRREKWVYWEQLKNKAFRESNSIVLDNLRILGYMELDSNKPTEKAIRCKLVRIDNVNRIKWNKIRYLTICRNDRRRIKKEKATGTG